MRSARMFDHFGMFLEDILRKEQGHLGLFPPALEGIALDRMLGDGVQGTES